MSDLSKKVDSVLKGAIDVATGVLMLIGLYGVFDSPDMDGMGGLELVGYMIGVMIGLGLIWLFGFVVKLAARPIAGALCGIYEKVNDSVGK